MQKSLAIAILLLVLTTVPVMASAHQNDSDHVSEKSAISQKSEHAPAKEEEHASTAETADDVSISPTISPSVTVTPTASLSPQPRDCDPDSDWKNHGQYVSCVAHHHEDKEDMVEAAHSDIGKKHPHVTPRVSPSTSPTVSPSETPSGTPSASPSPITSAQATLGLNQSFLTDNIFVHEFRHLLDALTSLVSSFGHSHKHQ